MLDFAVTAFVSILFLVDPPGTVPAFVALTANYPPARRRRTALVAAGSFRGGEEKTMNHRGHREHRENRRAKIDRKK